MITCGSLSRRRLVKAVLKLRSRFILAAALLAAAPVSAAADMLPAAVGNKWEYETVKLTRATLSVDGRPLMMMKDAASGMSCYEFVSVDEKSGAPSFGYVERTELQSAVNARKETEKNEIRLISDENAVRIVSTASSSEDGSDPRRETYDPPLLYFDKNAAVGKQWPVGEMRDGGVRSLTTARVAGRETVSVPAGTFRDCLKVVYSSDEFVGTIEIMNKTFKMTGGRSRGIYWISEGVGVVKELEVSVTSAESPGPNGKPVRMQTAVCSVSELKPGYTVKGLTVNGRQ